MSISHADHCTSTPDYSDEDYQRNVAEIERLIAEDDEPSERDRRISELYAEDRVAGVGQTADLIFFEVEYPGCEFYARPLTPNELEIAELTGELQETDEGDMWVAVWHIGEGCFVRRQFFTTDPLADVPEDINESIAREVHGAPPPKSEPLSRSEFAERIKRLGGMYSPSGCWIDISKLNMKGFETTEDEEQTTENKPTETGKAWPTLAPEALHGLAGKVVKVIEPHTESDPVALLIQFLVSFGSALGRRAYYITDGNRQYTNLFAVLVGQSSKSRKGTSAERVRQVMLDVDFEWAQKCIHSGLSSGEGLIWQIRDAVRKLDREGNEVVEVQGVDDKRLFLDEREFFQALTVMKREGNTVSRIVRDAWDSRPLASLTKNSPARVTEPHISISAHITEDELRRTLDQTSMANGYANRFLFVCVRRSKELPHGGNLEVSEIEALAKEVRAVFSKAADNPFSALGEQQCKGDQITMDAEAHALWTEAYHELSNGHPGLLGAITGRAEAQTIRLALLYALLDGSKQIKAVHLRAALALWQYCEDSARHIFGDSVGDPFADNLLQALRNSGGMTRTEINNMFRHNRSADKIDAALGSLETYGRARREHRAARGGAAGRPVEVWFAT
jgi:hypothetical protein